MVAMTDLVYLVGKVRVPLMVSGGKELEPFQKHFAYMFITMILCCKARIVVKIKDVHIN